MAVPVIVDCDPGHDDAIALVVAARHTELLGVTTVAGNAPIERTTRNALVILDLLGHDAPVHQGAARPLLAAPVHAGYVHGESGLDGADLPEPERTVAGEDAVAFLVETARAREGLWLVPTGPLTNIALALRRAPDLPDRIAGISLMGGSATVGNRTAVAEFNIWADPEAAAVVFDYGGPLIQAGLHLTHELQTTPERLAALRAMPNRLGPLLGQLLDFFATTYITRHDGFVGRAGARRLRGAGADPSRPVHPPRRPRRGRDRWTAHPRHDRGRPAHAEGPAGAQRRAADVDRRGGRLPGHPGRDRLVPLTRPGPSRPGGSPRLRSPRCEPQ